MADRFIGQHMPDAKFVEVRENHDVWHFVYARVVEGVMVYPDTVQLKVAKNRPEILGVNALEYVQQEQIPLSEVKDINWDYLLQPTAKVEQSRLVVIEGKQYAPVICYEALITYKLYVNAHSQSIEKIEIIN